MTEAVRLFVLFVDDLAAEVWKPVLTAAAETGGWDVLGGTVDNWAQMTHRCLVLSDDPDWAIVIPAARSAVVMMGPARWEGRDPKAAKDKDALALASARLAKASAMIEAGAVRVGGQMTSWTLPELGPLERPAAAIAIPAARPSPLDIYRTIPPQAGAAAIWPADGFSYPVGKELDGGVSAIDLTGRARVLFHGPHLYLTPGLWRATFQISVDPEGTIPSLRFEWKHGESAVQCEAPINQPGRYEIRLERRWDVVGPSQIAGIIQQAVFQGRFELHDCKVEMLSF